MISFGVLNLQECHHKADDADISRMEQLKVSAEDINVSNGVKDTRVG